MMGISREQKQAVVQELVEKLGNAKGAVLTDFRGINVIKVTELRRQLRAAGVDFKVVKNTLAKRATSELGITDLDQYLEGATAIAYSPRIRWRLPRRSPNSSRRTGCCLSRGLVEGSVITADGVQALADLPPRKCWLLRWSVPLQRRYLVSSMFCRALSAARLCAWAVRKQKEEANSLPC